jgi:pyrimidine operon attenuation protein/uracil phosphoribosyltransferase
MSTPLPSVDTLIDQLAAQMRPHMTPDTVLVGIHTGGVWIAERLKTLLGLPRPLASIDVSFHRDDHHLGSGLRAGGKASHLPDTTEGAHLVVVDDVLNTGRTLRAAMNEIFDYGRPAKIELAVLADRGGRELPVAATYCPQQVSLPAGQVLKLARDNAGQLTFSLDEK